MAGCFGNSFEDRHFEGQLMRHLEAEDVDTCYLSIKDEIIETAHKGHFAINKDLSELIDHLIEAVLTGGCQDCKNYNNSYYKDCERPINYKVGY
jgi:hypothetical protein